MERPSLKLLWLCLSMISAASRLYFERPIPFFHRFFLLMPRSTSYSESLHRLISQLNNDWTASNMEQSLHSPRDFLFPQLEPLGETSEQLFDSTSPYCNNHGWSSRQQMISQPLLMDSTSSAMSYEPRFTANIRPCSSVEAYSLPQFWEMHMRLNTQGYDGEPSSPSKTQIHQPSALVNQHDLATGTRKSRSPSFKSTAGSVVQSSPGTSYDPSGHSRSSSPSLSDLRQYGVQRSNGTWTCAYPGCRSHAVFTRGCDLRKHHKRHRKSFFCQHEWCPQSVSGGFSSKKDLARHEAKHNPRVPCEWEGCDRVFSRVDNMVS